MTIQEMVAELGRTDRRNELTRALDKKCVEAGIAIEKGKFTYSISGNCTQWFNGTAISKIGLSLPAADQHALEGYLLSKNT